MTNVPGPQQPLQTLGRRLLESFPFVPLIGNVRVSIAIYSSSDIEVLTKGVGRGVAQLLRASQPADRKREVAPKRPKSEARSPGSTDRPPTRRA